ncbi:MAG: zinc-dependent metalloprotease family protein [Saprospiraceae bacterium]
MKEKETALYEKPDLGTNIFTFPTEDLLNFIKNPNRDIVRFILKVGDFETEVKLMGKKRFLPVSKENSRHEAVSMNGFAGNELIGKVSILVSPYSFYATIALDGKMYKISNAKRGGKVISKFFCLVESQYAVKVQKDGNTNAEDDPCGIVWADFGLQIDESFADHFSSLATARDFAFSAFSDADFYWSELDSRIILNIVWLEDPYIGDPLWADPLSAWESNIRSDWETQRPCVRKDGIIYFTGKSLGGNVAGHTNASFVGICLGSEGLVVSTIGVAALNWNSTAVGRTVAHEIGHQFGLKHEDASPCNSDCPLPDTSLFRLMCNGGGSLIQLSPCMQLQLNSKFSSPRCECLAERIDPYTSDVCNRCFARVTDISVDNPNPTRICPLPGASMNFSATIKGGCNASIKPVRAKFRADFAQVEIGSNGRFSNFFTHTRLIVGNTTELIARMDPLGPNNDSNPEIEIDFADENVQLDISFNLKYVPSSTLPELNYFVSVYMDNVNVQFGVKEKIIEPFFTRVVQQGQTVLDVIEPGTTTRRFEVLGDLDFPFVTIPPPPPPNQSYLYEVAPPGGSSGVTGYNFTNFHFIMGAGNKFHLNGDTKLKLVNGSIEGCESMWAGIELEDQASIECVSSQLKEAQFAIKLKGHAIADIRQTTFENDNYGFHALLPTNVVPPTITLSGNSFVTTAPLKSTYSGQSPLPFDGKGYAGVYVDRVPALNISRAGGMNSQFENLHNGIIAHNTNLRISHTFFEDIELVSGAPNLPGTFISPGKGIYSRNGSLVVLGAGITAASPASFTNCHTAVEGQFATLSVTNSKMLSVNNGVISSVGINKNVKVIENDIQAKDRGIAVFHSLALPNGCQVLSNTVRMIGNAQGVGIKTGGSGDFWQQEGLFSLNTVIVTDGAAGIDVGASRNLKVTNNIVTLNNASTYYGIGISGGDLNAVNCNMIKGTGEKGIYGIMASRSNFVCNTASGTGIGLNFEGVFVGKGSIRVAGNTMDNNAGGGLLMGADAVIGEQVHQGNKWSGAGFTLAQHLGGIGLALKSLFTVDANQNTTFLPNIILPAQWFVNNSTPSTSYQCVSSNQDCPIIQSIPDYVREKEIATGQLTGLTYQASQLWMAQRRLYERLIEEGNPYPGDMDINNFLASSQTNGIKAYADLQMGIRQMFQTSTTDRNDLATYETQIVQSQDQLVLTEALLDNPSLSQQDSITLAAQRNSIKQDLANINTQRESKLDSLNNVRISFASPLYAQNAGLSGTGDYRVNEKMVNAIFLETMALGNTTFSSTQLAYLQAIAVQCPLSGGEAVQRARDMLALAQDAPAFYNDATTCGNSMRPPQKGVSRTQEGEFVRISPNPASESVVINYTFASDVVEKRMLLFNVGGQQVANILLPELEGEVTMPIKSLPSGVYHFIVTNSSVIGNLVITH